VQCPGLQLLHPRLLHIPPTAARVAAQCIATGLLLVPTHIVHVLLLLLVLDALHVLVGRRHATSILRHTPKLRPIATIPMHTLLLLLLVAAAVTR
jgi:predicted branched-subunit amino acid permease